MALHQGRFDSRLVEFGASSFARMKWENDHEFYLDGEKYDVVKVDEVNGRIVYHCINDKVEKKLINHLAGSEKKSSAIDEILKRIKLQLPVLEKFETLKTVYTFQAGYPFVQSCYSFSFSKFLNKPPNFI
jgi:hypothetical protein